MKEHKRFSPPAVGGVSLLVVFAVLALTVFALLSLSTAQADDRLADASVQAVTDYYEADCAAQEILARLRSGEMPPEVTVTEGVCTYRCLISDTQELLVELLLDGQEYTVLRWQAVSTETWTPDDSLDLWDGELAELPQ